MSEELRIGKPLTGQRPVEILLVEDNPGDVRLTAEALRINKVDHTLHVVGDGVAATTFLHREGKYRDAPRPQLILLDLSLPKKDGRDLLAEIKHDPNLKRIPIVVLTASRTERDILRVYNLYGNCYVVKPINMEDFIAVIGSIKQFWLTTAQLPPDEES